MNAVLGYKTSSASSTLKAAQVPAPPHPLSLSLMRGRGIAYLRPTVTGSIDQADLACLTDLADPLSRH